MITTLDFGKISGNSFIPIQADTPEAPENAKIDDLILNSGEAACVVGGVTLERGGIARVIALSPFAVEKRDGGNLLGPKGDDGYAPVKGVDYFDGNVGPPGEKGDKGDAGVGVPRGGGTGQVLVKQSDVDYDADWQDINVGGGSGGSGGMEKNVYDPQGKETDIFKYVDETIGNIASVLQEINSIADRINRVVV